MQTTPTAPNADEIQLLTRDVLEREEQNKSALRLLLDQKLGEKDRLLVHTSKMGGTESYLTSARLRWVGSQVRYASQLKLFADKKTSDNAGNNEITIDETTIDILMQRPLDFSRDEVLAEYLLTQKNRKFPPLLLVISQDWVENDQADEWGADGRAAKSSAAFQPLDSEGAVGLLDVSANMQVYALDGQHRLMGIKAALELLDSGQLEKRDRRTGVKVRKNKKTAEQGALQIKRTLEDLLHGHESESSIQSLDRETVGVEIINAVVAGETRDEARRRVRSIFVHVNKSSVPLTRGQNHALDEDGGFSIVARWVATRHHLFSSSGKVDFQKNQIAKRAQTFTTLQTLAEMVQEYFKTDGSKVNWMPSRRGTIPNRPPKEELEESISKFNAFLDAFARLPSVNRMVQGTKPLVIREEEANVLFRPVGQVMLAAATGALVHEKGQTLERVFSKLEKLDSRGHFSQLNTSKSYWWGLLYDPQRDAMTSKGLNTAVELLLYLVTGGESDEKKREDLRQRVAKARSLDGEGTDFGGTKVKEENMELPAPL